jgi:hypothetical protein
MAAAQNAAEAGRPGNLDPGMEHNKKKFEAAVSRVQAGRSGGSGGSSATCERACGGRGPWPAGRMRLGSCCRADGCATHCGRPMEALSASQTHPRDSAAISSRAGQAISLRLPPCRRLSSRAEALLWWSDARGRADNASPAAVLSLWLLRVSCARACEACPARGPAAVDSAHTAHTSPSRDERTLHRVTRRLSKRPRSREKRRLLRA